MAVLQLLGRSTYGPRVPSGRGVSPLWAYFSGPPAQNSVVIYENGGVVEQAVFDTSGLRPEQNVHTFILGGTDYRCESGSFEHQSLLAAGYTFREVTPRDTYAEDYSGEYP